MIIKFSFFELLCQLRKADWWTLTRGRKEEYKGSGRGVGGGWGSPRGVVGCQRNKSLAEVQWILGGGGVWVSGKSVNRGIREIRQQSWARCETACTSETGQCPFKKSFFHQMENSVYAQSSSLIFSVEEQAVYQQVEVGKPIMWDQYLGSQSDRVVYGWDWLMYLSSDHSNSTQHR